MPFINIPSTIFSAPIPNGPFYSPETTYIKGPYYSWIPSSTSGYNFITGTFTSGGGGGSGTVTQINTGAGLTGGPITTTGTISLASSGVTAGTYTYSTVTVNSAGQVTVASSGAAPLPLAGGTMTGLIVFAAGQTFPDTISTVSGTFPIAVSTVSQNSTVSVAAASTTQSGVVQLFNATNGTSTSLALTAAQGKFLQDQIDALIAAGGLILAGALDIATGFMESVTSQGSANGFTVGAVLPNAAVINDNNFVICASAGTYTPPGGSAQVVNQGDWFFSDGTSWQYFPAGAYYGYASTTVAGIVQLADSAATIAGTDATLVVTPAGLQTKVASATAIGLVELATDAETITGTDATRAVTPAGLQAKVASTTAIGLVELATDAETITGTDATRAVTPAGLSARVATLTATGIVQLEDSITSTSTTTAATPNSVRLALDAAIPNTLLTAKGSLIAASAALTPEEQLVGGAGEFLTVDSSTTTGLAWTNTISGGTY